MLLVWQAIGVLIGAGALVCFLLNSLLGIEVLSALRWQPRPNDFEDEGNADEPPSFTVLVPAHDEAPGIGRTLEGLLVEVSSPHQICVVADNCSDETAAVARDYGVTVLERHDEDLIGKGYALDFGLTHLAEDPPDVVVVVDADCQLTAGTLDGISRRAAAENRPVQAVYRMAAPENPSPKDGLSAFAFTVKNRVRASGLSLLKMPILLAGTGMAFPWEALQHVEVANGDLVEDVKLGIDLAIAGYPSALAIDRCVIGQLPGSDEAAKSQRTRWEHGHLESLKTNVPKLMSSAFQQKRLGLLIMALDLAIPPLSLWVVLGATVTIAAAVLAVVGGVYWPLLIQGIADLLLVAFVFIAWLKWRPETFTLLQLLSIPLYVLWKIPIYLKFLASPQKAWVRTERD